MRYGLMSNTRRSWSKVGARALLAHQQEFLNRYLFSAVAPLSGESFHAMGFDIMDSETELAFLEALKKEHPDQHVMVVIDNAPSHRGKAIHAIDGLTLIHLPPYSPELNPTERFFEEMRRETACRVFDGLAPLEERISRAVNRWADDTPAMKQLLGYGWIKEQCGVVSEVIGMS